MPRPQESGLLVVILLLGLLLYFLGGDITRGDRTYNNFLRLDNLLTNVATPMTWIAVMAVGATIVIISGGIDISVGSIFGLSALGAAAVLQYLPTDAPSWYVLPIGIAVPIGIGLLCGLLNGALVVFLRMHPFIVTLGTLSIFRGIALIAVDTKSLPLAGREIPPAFTDSFIAWTIRYERDGGVPVLLQPVPMLIMLACVTAAWVFLAHTPWGRQVYAVGGNEEAARFSGIRVGATKLLVYAISGVSAGIAGMASAGFYKSATTGTGEGYELSVIAAAVVGGASLSGGRGTALGAFLGAAVIRLIENGIAIVKTINLGVVTITLSREYSKIIIGSAIIVAVAVDRLSEYLHQRRLRSRGPS